MAERNQFKPAKFIPIFFALLTMSACSVSNSEGEDVLKKIEWTADKTIFDHWTADDSLSEKNHTSLSRSLKDAVPIKIVCSEIEEKADEIDSSEGGVSAKYVLSELATGQGQYQNLNAFLDELNKEARTRSSLEISEGIKRHSEYKKMSHKDYLYLTTWISPEFTRCDSQILSMIKKVYRYNREVEPNFYEVHGKTIDVKTGRELTLKDIFTDTSVIPDLIWDSLVEAGYRVENSRGEFVPILSDAIEGMRDDGAFAWSLCEDGIRFYAVVKIGNGKNETHRLEDAFIPFSVCGGLLREGIGEASYDYIVAHKPEDMENILESSVPLYEDGKYFSGYFHGKIKGHEYIYGCDSSETYIYSLSEGIPQKIGQQICEIYDGVNGSFYTPLSPSEIEMKGYLEFLQEFSVSGNAKIDEEGMLKMNGEFVLDTNAIPMVVAETFETDIFATENAQESYKGDVVSGDMLLLYRTDGMTYADAYFDSDGRLCRLYIEKDGNGWKINGMQKDDLISFEGWPEE